MDDARTRALELDRLLRAGGADLLRPPWLHGGRPPSAVDLVHLALWRARRGAADDEDLLAALRLLPAARAELDQLEAALLFTARSAGLSWRQVSAGMGLASRQAAQQRFDRSPAAWTPAAAIELGHRSDPADLALHGVRVLGFPTSARIAARFGLDRDAVEEDLLDAEPAAGCAR